VLPLSDGLRARRFPIVNVSIIVANTLWETVLQSEIPQDVLSRVSSYDWAVSLVFMPIGFALWGPISDLVGVETAFVAAAVVSAAAKVGPVAVPEVRNMRRATEALTRVRQAHRAERLARPHNVRQQDANDGGNHVIAYR